MNGYELSRAWFNWSFENPEKIKPNHTALYFFIIEHCNRMGWVEKFGLPTEMAKTAIGISNYRTYTNTLNDLIAWGFIILIQKSQNQFSSNIVAIVKNTISHTKSLDKATHKHHTEQSISTAISTDSISKPITNNIEPRTGEQPPQKNIYLEIEKEDPGATPPQNLEIPLPAKMQQEFLNEMNSEKTLYVSKPSSDMPAILEIINFISAQDFGGKNYPDFTYEEVERVLKKWKKWIEWFKNFGKGNSLDTWILKFDNIQKIYIDVENGRTNGNIETFGSSESGKLGASEKRAAAAAGW